MIPALDAIFYFLDIRHQGTDLKSLLRTPLSVSIVLFLVSGLVGYWASYDPAVSLPKLLMLAGAVLVYYAIVALRHTRSWFRLAIWGYIVGGAAAAIYFIAQTDFGASPTKFEILTRIGVGLHMLLPRFTDHSPHPNLAAGALEIVLPFALFAAIHGWRQRAWLATSTAALCTGVILLGLLLTTSRGAWLAIMVVLGSLVFVRGAVALLRRARVKVRAQFLVAGIGFGILFGIAAYLVYEFQVTNLLDSVGASGTAASRFELYGQTWELIKEYFMTGAGLGVFPMVFSAYVLLIDAPFYVHAHNIFLAVWIEQGILGIGALLWLLTAFARWGWRNRQAWNWVTTSGYIAVGIWLVHGLVDAPLYASHALLVLFAPFAFAIPSVSNDAGASEAERSQNQPHALRDVRAWIAVVLLVIGFLVVYWNDWNGMLYANLGAVAETKAELPLYRFYKPIIEIRSIIEIRRTLTTELAPAQAFYRTALAYDPANVVAHRHLGLIALAKRNFREAVSQLETAARLDPGNRATRKGLGYAYAWNGAPQWAAEWLKPFEETRLELQDDTWWWNLEGRPDLAVLAQQALDAPVGSKVEPFH